LIGRAAIQAGGRTRCSLCETGRSKCRRRRTESKSRDGSQEIGSFFYVQKGWML